MNEESPLARSRTIERFLAGAGWPGAARRLLAGDASFRRYDRLTMGGASAVLMDAPPPREDVRPFIRVASLLTGLGLSAPRILAADEEAGLLLLEDLGDDTYARLLGAGADESALYRLAVDFLIELHRRVTPEGLAQLPPFDDERALREVRVPLEWYWPAVMAEPIDARLRDTYISAWASVLPLRHAVPESIALFDFHIDNLLWLPERPGAAACGVLDFQDAVRAPVPFDLMSLIEDARRDVAPALAEALIQRYLAAFPALERSAFMQSFAVLGAQRHARILGTFARLWRRDAKPVYLSHLSRVWRQLEAALGHPATRPVRDWFDRHWPADRRVPLVAEASAP